LGVVLTIPPHKKLLITKPHIKEQDMSEGQSSSRTAEPRRRRRRRSIEVK
jgi:hypothetical protein